MCSMSSIRDSAKKCDGEKIKWMIKLEIKFVRNENIKSDMNDLHI